VDATIVKIGGSLALNPQKLRNLCCTLYDISKTRKIIIVPGGGEFADAVRALDKRFALSTYVSHQMAILAMDQYGYVLSDLIPNSCIIDNFGKIKTTFDSEKIPIFLPSKYFAKNNPLPNSWEITSDSIAIYFAVQLATSRVILLTDVDGIFTKDPKKSADAKLIPTLSIEEIDSFEERTSVDKYLPKLLAQLKIKCYVVNGQYPQRLQEILNRKKTVCTLIT